MKKQKTTYEKFIEDPHQKKLLEEEYQDLLIDELLIAIMEENNLSVRKLANAAGLSPTIIQEIKTGKRKNITVTTFSKIVDACGYEIKLKRKAS